MTSNQRDSKKKDFPFVVKRRSDLHDVEKVNLVFDDGMKIVSVEDAMNSASDEKMDLVVVTFTNDYYVCKIMDYGKKKYKEKQKRKNSANVKKNKQIQINFNIAPHDLNIKIDHVEKFLTSGHSVEIIIKMKGRELVHADKCELMANEIVEKLAPFSKLNEKKRLNNSFLITLRPSATK